MEAHATIVIVPRERFSLALRSLEAVLASCSSTTT
jgi:hypothetical protein